MNNRGINNGVKMYTEKVLFLCRVTSAAFTALSVLGLMSLFGNSREDQIWWNPFAAARALRAVALSSIMWVLSPDTAAGTAACSAALLSSSFCLGNKLIGR